jgi:hypothetical protein
MNLNENLRWLGLGLSDDILRCKARGDFDGAIRLIEARLAKESTPELFRCGLLAEKELLRRLPTDYPMSRGEALACVREHIPDFSAEEFTRLEEDGRIDWIYCQGEKRYFRKFFETLCKTDDAFAARTDLPRSSAAGELRDETIQKMKEQGTLSARFRCRVRLRIRDSVFHPGMRLRVYLPIPCVCANQSEIRIERVTPSPTAISLESAPQRVVFWEEIMTENHPFSVEFSYVQTAHYVNLEQAVPDLWQPSFDTEEVAPHILFTPTICALEQELSAGAKNPLEKARRFYEFITKNVHYSYMREYFCIENIPEFCARNLVGDCGVQALLFITLCRKAGIPARIQGGWRAEPTSCCSHDWAQFYIAPFGWLYADPSFGGAAYRAGAMERWQYYFGNLDPHRMVANTRFQAQFNLPEDHWRADPYDNQNGEAETEERGLLDGEFDTTREVLKYQEL